MKVKLIQPRMLKRPMDTDLKIRMSPHLGLLTVANIIRHECEITIENENIREIDFNDVPDLVGIAVTVDVLPRAIEIAALYRKKGAKVIAGGIHITTAEELINLIKMAMDNNIPYTYFKNQIFTHPTMAENLNDLCNF